MRVRHRDSMKSPASANRRDAGIVDEPEAIPQKVAPRRLQQKRALTDADLRVGADSREARLEVAPLDPATLRPQLGKGGPFLASGRQVLPLVVTDRAGRR